MDGHTPASSAIRDSDAHILQLWPTANAAAPVQPSTPVHTRIWPTRVIVCLAVLAVAGMWTGHVVDETPTFEAATVATISCALLALFSMVCGYWADPALRRVRTLNRDARQTVAAIERWTAEEQQLLSTCEQLQHVIAQEEERIEVRRTELQSEGRTRHHEARKVCQQAIADAEARREALLQSHQQQIADLHLEYEAVGAAFRGRLADLSQQGELETAARLAEHQHHHVAGQLAELWVADSDLADDVKGRLMAAGVHTLAQLTSERVVEAGFHTLQVEALLSWRQGVQRTLRQETPQELPADETREVITRYHAMRREMEQEKQRAHARLAAALADAEVTCQATLAEINATISQLQLEWKAYRRAIGATYEARFTADAIPHYADLARQREELAQASNALLGVQIELAGARQNRQRLYSELEHLPTPNLPGYVIRVLGWPGALPARSASETHLPPAEVPYARSTRRAA